MRDRWADRVLSALRAAGSPLDDDRLAFRLGASQRQTINIVCRRLEAAGVLKRHPGPDGKIVNVLISGADVRETAPTPTAEPPNVPLLTEDEVKSAVNTYLEMDGWSVTVAWGRDRGVDIEAHRGTEHLYLEANGEAGNPPQQMNLLCRRPR